MLIGKIGRMLMVVVGSVVGFLILALPVPILFHRGSYVHGSFDIFIGLALFVCVWVRVKD